MAACGTLERFTVMHSAKVLLHWLSRPTARSPFGQHFSRTVRFDHQGDDWTNDVGAWLWTSRTSNSQGDQDGTVVLTPTAPHEWLSVGKKFTLFEGVTPVAKEKSNGFCQKLNGRGGRALSKQR
jgi:hypothetical protein